MADMEIRELRTTPTHLHTYTPTHLHTYTHIHTHTTYTHTHIHIHTYPIRTPHTCILLGMGPGRIEPGSLCTAGECSECSAESL